MSKGRGTIWKRPETGRWSFRVDLPPVNGKRREVRKHGFATRREAAAALDEVIEAVRRTHGRHAGLRASMLGGLPCLRDRVAAGSGRSPRGRRTPPVPTRLRVT